MSEATATAPAGWSVSKTTGTTSGIACAVIVLLWAFKCIAAHAIIVPTYEQAAAMVAVASPFAHLISVGILNRLGKWAGPDRGAATQ